MPQRASTITGVVSMFRQGSSAIYISLVTIILQYVGNIGLGFEIIFIAMGVILLAAIPLVFVLSERSAVRAQ